VAKRTVQTEISPALRKHVTGAAEKIRAAHKTELADILKADCAGRLFTSIIRSNGKPPGSPKEPSGVFGDGVGLLADEFGGLVSDAIRTGTGLLEGSLTVLAQAWMTTVTGPLAKPKRGVSSPAGTGLPDASRAQPPSAPQTAEAVVETAVPGNQAPEMPILTSEEVMLQGVLRQFMPMLLTTLNQGGDGYGLARTVITLFGRPTYDQASKLGSDKIMQLVKREPDLWAQVAPIEDKFSRFLDEFTGYAD
jgi:hypothetical protein